MKKSMLIAAMIGVIVVAFYCRAKTQKAEASLLLKGPNSRTARNSLEWDGIYRGVMPCADCQGIQKTVALRKDLTYLVETKYLGKDDSARQSTGKFSWNDQGNTITVNELGKTTRYYVGENILTQLIQNNSQMTSEWAAKYILRKEGNHRSDER